MVLLTHEFSESTYLNSIESHLKEKKICKEQIQPATIL